MDAFYDNPEEYGLKIVGVLDEEDLSYEFNTLWVLKHKSGKMFYAISSGCSCPEPFEEYYFNDENDNDLIPITKETFESFVNEVRGFPVSVVERNKVILNVEKYLSK